MTDNENIKAFECCEANEGDSPNCEECPYFGLREKPSDCYKKARKGVLDLINRQKAEIERLNNLKRFEKFIDERIHTDKVRNAAWEFKAKEDRDEAFEKELEKLFDIANARAEAIKEFAERLNKEAEKVYIDREGDFVEAHNEIYYTVADWCKETSDNLVKEMAGAESG